MTRSPRGWLGLLIVAALACLPVACGNRGGSENLTVSQSSGGSGGQGVGGGLPAGGSGTGTTGSGAQTSTSGTTTGNTTTTTTTGSGGNLTNSTATVFDMIPQASQGTNLAKPVSRLALSNGLVAVQMGFNFGQGNGQILFMNPNTVNGTASSGQPATPSIMNSTATSPINASTFSSPWDLITDGSNLLMTDGTGQGNNNGRVLRITNISTGANVTANVSNAANATNGTYNNPLFLAFNPGTRIVFVSEYNSNPNGQVQRIDLNASSSNIVMNQLNFPAGLACDGTNLYICQQLGNGGSLGSVLRVPVSALNSAANGTPLGSSNGNVTVISPGDQTQQFNRPWMCALDPAGGLVIVEGFGLTVPSGAPGPNNNPGTARLRYVTRANLLATNPVDKVILGGLTAAAGLNIDTAGSVNGNTVAFFVESPAQAGTARSVTFNTTTFAISSNLQYATGLQSPIDTLPTPGVPNGLPLFVAVNFAASNSRVLNIH